MTGKIHKIAEKNKKITEKITKNIMGQKDDER